MNGWLISNNNMKIVANSLTPRYAGKIITVSVDPSKTNTAVVVKTLNNVILDVFELSGNQIKLKEVEKYGRYLKKFFRVLFKDADVRYTSIEDIITKKDVDVSNTHEVRFALTYIFSTIYNELDDIMKGCGEPLIVSNQVWKEQILGEFNKKNGKKNSIDYLKSIRHPYALYSDDVTDVICISEYMHKVCKIKGSMTATPLPLAVNTYTLLIVESGKNNKKCEHTYEHVQGVNVEHELNSIAKMHRDSKEACLIVQTEDFPVNLYSPSRTLVCGNINGMVTEIQINIGSVT